MKTPRVIYYKDELNDDFSQDIPNEKPISKNYVYYSSNPFWQIKHFFWNKIVAYPVSILHAKFKFHWKVENKQVLKLAKHKSYFIYGNHTQQFFDASMPKKLSPFHESYVMVNHVNLNIKGIGWLVKRLGALPVPTNVAESKKFISAIDTLVKHKKSILIYPEAHIWPYYTKIRPFVSTSFRYPVKYDVPAFCFTNTYQKTKNPKKVKIVTYVDGPFYPNLDLPAKEQIQDLRDRIYSTMVERSKNSNVELIKYEKIDDSKKENTND